MEKAQSQARVVPIRQNNNRSTSRNTMSVEKQRVIKASVNLLKSYLQKMLVIHLEKSEQQLFDAIDSKKIDAATGDIKVLQKASLYIPSLYIDSVIKNLSSFSASPNPTVGEAFASSVETEDWSGLQLLGTDEIEGQLLIDGYIANCESELADVLYALARRIEFVSGTDELKASKNPFGPAILLKTYVELLKGESFSKQAHNILCESFSQEVLTNLGDVLGEINEVFVQAGILPTLPKPKIKNTNAAVKRAAQSFANEKVVHTNHEQAPVTEQPITTAKVSMAEIDPALYTGLVEMAQVYRSQQGDSMVSDGLTVSGQQLPTTELVDTLTHLQKEGAVEGIDIAESVRLKIGERIQVDGQRQPYAEQDDTLIDVVAMFFDVILQDRQLPDTVRAMIAQLQIPILKVAMIDKEFFAKKSHPARKFLNAMSQAGLGVSEKNRQIRSAVFEKMEELVERVLMEFDNDVEIFAELNEEFDVFMEQQQRQIDVIEERSRKVTKSTEQLELTKRQAAYEIALRLNGKSVPEFIQLFLDDAWKDVLVLALLRREREPQETQKCIEVIDRLVVSVVEPADDAARELIIEGLARLLKDIKVGLENISYDFHQSVPFFKELESWHKQLLVMRVGEQDNIPVAEKVVMVEVNEDLCDNLEEDLLQELESKKAQMPNDKFSKLASKIDVGDWVEYTGEDGGVLRAKLSWKSSVTMQCLFVNDCGVKAMDISLDDLAEAFRQKRMTIIGQERAPLVDRVLAGMKSLMTSKSAEPGLA